MHFLLGLFVGTFMGIVIIGLCRSMALGVGGLECSESRETESRCIHNGQAEIALPLR